MTYCSSVDALVGLGERRGGSTTCSCAATFASQAIGGRAGNLVLIGGSRASVRSGIS